MTFNGPQSLSKQKPFTIELCGTSIRYVHTGIDGKKFKKKEILMNVSVGIAAVSHKSIFRHIFGDSIDEKKCSGIEMKNLI